ncbi:MAG: hypothetical protein JWO91_2932 [Acidobacteriaceae bacterium]|nr:hypothetical protein [Acidobacteriaceae bacterium]
MTSDIRPDKLLSFALAFIGGYGDAASMVLAKTFTGHVTGSLVLAAIALAAHEWRALLVHLLAVVFFLTGVLFGVLIGRALTASPSWQPLPTVVGIEVILTMTAYLALASRAGPGPEIFVVCMALTLGLQNGAFQRTGGISVHTTYLTGMITSLITTEAKLPHPVTRPDPKASILSGIWLAFFLGAAMGADLTLQFKEVGILGATFVLIVIFVRARATALHEHSTA